MFVAEHEGKLHILVVIESKSPSNVGELAAKRVGGRAEFLGQPEMDFERLRQVPTQVGDRWYQPRDVVVSRHSTLWIGVTPAGGGLSGRAVGRIQAGISTFSQTGSVVRDGVMNELARRVLDLTPTDSP